MKTDNSKLRLLKVLEILRTDSDSRHPISTAKILEQLEKYGIEAERKAIYRDIEAINASGIEVELAGSPKKGYFLNSRNFEVPEICLLIDAVQSAGFIPKKSTEQLVKKLQSEVSVYEAAALRDRVCIMNRSKSENENIYRIIEALNTAIIGERMVKLVYMKTYLDKTVPKTVSKEMTISPYALLWEADRYYLIGNNRKYDNLTHLRIDRISSIEILDVRARHFSEVSEYSQRFDTADYAKKAFNMFGGERCRIDLECDIKLLQQITDRFSDGIFIRHSENEPTFRFSVEAMLSEGLIGWIMQFGGGVRVISPESLRLDVLSKAEQLTAAFANR